MALENTPPVSGTVHTMAVNEETNTINNGEKYGYNKAPQEQMREERGATICNGDSTTAYLYEGPVVASLVSFSMIGVLIRIYLSRLFEYQGEPVFGLIWAQMTGCFIMGVVSCLKPWINKLTPSLHLGLSTGLCGSITTFSSWHLGIYAEFFNTKRYDHSRFKNFLGGLSVIAVTLGCSISAFNTGKFVGREARALLDAYDSKRHSGVSLERICTSSISIKSTNKKAGWIMWNEWKPFDIIMTLIAIFGTVATVLVIALAGSTRSVSISLLFGPIGTIIRWKLSKLNTDPGILKGIVSSHFPGFPVGTFIANICGTAILAVINVLQTGGVVSPSIASCQVLSAIKDGFCGCLTTVSTFVAEIVTRSPRQSLIYITISIVIAQVLVVLISGIYFKTSTIDYPTC